MVMPTMWQEGQLNLKSQTFNFYCFILPDDNPIFIFQLPCIYPKSALHLIIINYQILQLCLL